MVERELPESVRDPLEEIIVLCNEYNIPEKNLRESEFVPDEIAHTYSALRDAVENYPNISWLKVQRSIGENIDIDLSEETKFYLWDIAVIQKREIVLNNYPELKQKINNGLIRVPKSADMNKNGFEYQDHYLIFDNRFSQNFHLVGLLNDIRDDAVEVHVPITFDQLGDPDTTRKTFLKEHWAGPETVDRLQARRAPEFIQKGTESYKEGIMDRTEFYFYKRDDDWHVQIEELLPQDGVRYSPHTKFQGNEIKFYTRYVHAILGPDCELCYHLDGAFRSYRKKPNFIKRHRDLELRQSKRLKEMSDRYKFFKVDSPDSGFIDYQELIGLFFKNNPHVVEFFEGESVETREMERNRSQSFRFNFDNDYVDF